MKSVAALALSALCWTAGPARAEDEPLSGEQRMRQEAIQKIQEAMGPSFVPPASAPAPVKPAARRATVSPVRQITAAANTGFRCLPTCATDDGRFLAIAGANFQTLSPPELTLQISVPAGSTSFQVGVFDGDGGEYQADGFTAYWDSGLTALFEYSLAADPTGDATGTTPVDLAPGQPVVYSNVLPDNDWGDFTVATGPEAMSPSGNYFYVLRIRLVDTTSTTLNSFKVRSTATISGVTLNPVERPFSYIAPWTALEDISVIYPLFPVPVPTTYDGTFSFYLDVPASQTQVSLWDGDFDHGDFLLTEQDTDDPDTPNAPFLPTWSTPEVASEGVASGAVGSTGNPPDDDDPLGFGVYSVRTPAVRYEVRFPDGQVFTNSNPSGNREWEQFKISTAPFDPTQMDYSTSSIPPGTYELRISGVDMLNLNSLLLPFRVLCVDELGAVCQDIPRPFRIGDTVFRDEDGDGAQDAGETGISGVVLELRDGAGVLIGTATTDADGHYSFDVEAGSYAVSVAASSFGPGGALAGTIATTPAQQSTTIVDDNDLALDFGYRGNGSIGDRVWYDIDSDGAPDASETGINGVTVELLDGGGNVAGSTTTAGDGNYTFDHLFAGTYSVRIVASTLPSGLVETYDLDGTGSANVATLTLVAGANRTDVDFGYRGTASVGDRVWYDIDGDAVQDPAESGIAGVTVQLVDGGGNVIATTVTGANGIYSFNNLVAGTYTVRVVASTLPGEGAPTYDFDGIATPDAAVVTLTDGQTRTDVDFGYRGTSALGDRVWYDINANGVQDADEVGLNGVTVELLDGAGNVLLATTTSGNGGYSFAGLLPGTYRVRVVASTLPGGAVATYDLDGTATPHIAAATLASGQNLSTVDFGYRGTGSLGDRVWLDLDSDGVQDSGEPGLNGVAVELLDSAGNVLASRSTTAAGIYGFTNLLAGTYTARVVSATLPPGLVQTYDLDGTATANTANAALSAGQTRTDVDFGYRGTLQFGDRVWFDYDGNGIQDTGEPGLSGVTIELRDGSGTLIATTTTGANGLYSFSNLPAGTYTVTIVTSTLPGGAVPTYDLDGIATANTASVTLSAGQSRTDVDFGYRGTASLGNRVWLDFDGDGVQDAGENGINGVTVRLLDSAGNVIASAVTTSDGNYTFPNLLAGTYKVQVVSSTLPSGTVQTYDLDGTGTAHIATVAVAAGQNRTDADFGYRMPAAPGTGTIGYWKTHAEAWPVSTITVGGVVYTRDQSIVLLGTPSRGDKSIDLFKQLVAAKLNVIIGNDPSCISSTISSADAWMVAHPPGSGVSSSSSAWTQASPWHTQLDNYNNGQLCAPHRD